jgi:hypothetical protein
VTPTSLQQVRIADQLTSQRAAHARWSSGLRLLCPPGDDVLSRAIL